jgi:hypothetical protein
LNPVRPVTLNVAKKELPFFETSFKPQAMNMMNDSRFLQNVLDFGQVRFIRHRHKVGIKHMSMYTDLELWDMYT